MEKDHEEYNIGVLDIYGFEIFQVRKAGEVAEWRGVLPRRHEDLSSNPQHSGKNSCRYL